jgi:hypothetical protein
MARNDVGLPLPATSQVIGVDDDQFGTHTRHCINRHEINNNSKRSSSIEQHTSNPGEDTASPIRAPQVTPGLSPALSATHSPQVLA